MTHPILGVSGHKECNVPQADVFWEGHTRQFYANRFRVLLPNAFSCFLLGLLHKRFLVLQAWVLMMSILSFVLSPESVNHVHDAVLCLSKFSEVVSLEARQDRVRDSSLPLLGWIMLLIELHD